MSAKGEEFRIIDQTDAVLGDLVGVVRGLHVRAAVNKVLDAGRTSTDPKGVRGVLTEDQAGVATSTSSQSRPSSSRPLLFGVRPPHCLKKNSTSRSRQASRSSRTHSGSRKRWFGPLSPR
jgi:hypothetical protein